MCESRPGTRCAKATRALVAATHAALRAVFGADAPVVDPSGWTRNPPPEAVDQALVDQYITHLRTLKDTSPDHHIALERAQWWRNQLLTDHDTATCHTPQIPSPPAQMSAQERDHVTASLVRSAAPTVRRWHETNAAAEEAIATAWAADQSVQRAVLLAKGSPVGGTAHRRVKAAQRAAREAWAHATELIDQRHQLHTELVGQERRITHLDTEVTLTGPRAHITSTMDVRTAYLAVLEHRAQAALDSGNDDVARDVAFEAVQVRQAPSYELDLVA